MTLLELEPSTTTRSAPGAREATPSPAPGADVPRPRFDDIVPRFGRTASGRVERWVFWCAAAALFLASAWILSTARVLSGDTMSRTLSAANAVTGRDPHLESIGFIWPPFPAFFQVPIAWLSNWFPSLVSLGLAGTIVSALLMATMVGAVRQWLAECGVGVRGRVGIAALLALHPFILLYAGNGMSEASMLAFLVIGANRVARWWERESPLDLVMCGAALAMAYLSRYEVGLSILLVTAAVFVEGFRRAPGERKAHIRRGIVCAAAVSFIPISAIAAWAAWSWTTIGEPVAQFTSRYGNSAIVKGAGVASGAERLVLFAQQALLFGGAVVVLIGASVWFGTRGMARVVAVLTVVLAPLAFNVAAAYSGTTFAFARFTITLVPAAVMLLGPLLTGFRSDLDRSKTFARLASAAAVATFVAVALLGLPVMWQGRYGTGDEADQLRALPGPYHNDRPANGTRVIERMRKIAHDIDAMHLRNGAVLTDDFSSFLIVASSHHRTQFVTTPNRDFERVLSAPRIFGVKYLLVPDSNEPFYDAVLDVWPGVFDGANAIGTKAKEWGTPRQPSTHYRLIRISPRGGN